MKTRIIFYIGVLFVLATFPLALLAQVPQNVQKLSGNLTGGFHVPNGVTIDATGTGAISATSVASSWTGSTGITTLGTVTTGTWNATAIAADHGGTGQTSYTIGDLLYASSSSALSKLAAVATGQVLISAGTGTAPAWSANPVLSTITSPSGSDLNLSAGGTNQNISLKPTGTGAIIFNSNTANTISSLIPNFQIQGTSIASSALALLAWTGTTPSAATNWLSFRSRGSSVGSFTAVVSGDRLGQFLFAGDDGTSTTVNAASFRTEVDGTVSTGIIPGRILFLTGNSSGTLTEAMRINSAQVVSLAASTASTSTSTGALVVTGGVGVGGALNLAGEIGSTLGGEVASFVPTTGTNAAYLRFQNTGGAGYYGLDNSTGSAFSNGNYAFNIYSPTNVVTSVAGTARTTVSGTGLAVVGELSATTLRVNQTLTTGVKVQARYFPMNINGTVVNVLTD